MKTLKKFFKEFEVYIGTILLFAMFILLNVQVISRYAVGKAFTWTEEISTILFVWIAYLGASAAVYKQQHLRIDVILNLFHGVAKKVVLIFTDLVTMFFCIYMIKPLIEVIKHLTKLKSVTLITRLPMDKIYWILPVALALQSIRFVQEVIRIIKAPNTEVKTAGKTIFDTEEDDK